jgi:hypothetical protein
LASVKIGQELAAAELIALVTDGELVMEHMSPPLRR